MADALDPDCLPPLLKLEEVAALARRSTSSLRRYIGEGKLPRPNDQGLWVRDTVLESLGIAREVHANSTVQLRPSHGHWPTRPEAVWSAYLSLFPNLLHFQKLQFKRVREPLEAAPKQAPADRTLKGGQSVSAREHLETLSLAPAAHLFVPTTPYQPTRDAPMTFETLLRLVMASHAINHAQSLDAPLSHLRKAFAWSASQGHPDFRHITAAEMDVFLDETFSTEWIRLGVKSALRRMLSEAVRHGWLRENPVDFMRERKQPISLIEPWFREDVEAHVEIALELNQPGYAAFLLLEFEMGQRLNDLTRMGSSKHCFDGHYLSFWQQKTQAYQSLRVSDQAKSRLRQLGMTPDRHVFTNSETDRPFTYSSLRNLHAKASLIYQQRGGRRLTPHKLRHGCVAELVVSGATIGEIASQTGHSERSIYRIIAYYFPHDSKAAENGQRKRGYTYDDEAPAPIQPTAVIEAVAVRSGWSSIDQKILTDMAPVRRLVAADRLRRSQPFAVEGAGTRASVREEADFGGKRLLEETSPEVPDLGPSLLAPCAWSDAANDDGLSEEQIKILDFLRPTERPPGDRTQRRRRRRVANG